MAPTQRQSLLTVMAQATSPAPRLWPPEDCSEHQSLTMAASSSQEDIAACSSSASADKERAPWPVTLGTLLALQLGWGLWLMPNVYARYDPPLLHTFLYFLSDRWQSARFCLHCVVSGMDKGSGADLVAGLQAGVDSWNCGHRSADCADGILRLLDIAAGAEGHRRCALWGHWRGSCRSKGDLTCCNPLQRG